MIRYLFIILFHLTILIVADAQEAEYNIADRYYRYEHILEDTTDLFNNIKIQEHFYPCVDELEVVESSLSQADFELVSNTGYTEYYAYKNGLLSLIGTKSHDPFLSIPDMKIQFFTPIPLVRKNNQEQFNSQGRAEFFLAYKSRYWPKEIRDWAEDNGVTEIRITGYVEWDNHFKRTDFFRDIFMDDMIGNVIVYDYSYTVNKLEVKKEKWERLEMSTNGYLQDRFSVKREKYQSLYDMGSVVEKARIHISPYHSFSIQMNRDIGSYVDCTHDNNDIYVFPNPTFGDVNVRIEGSDKEYYVLNIYNIIGKKLWSKRIDVSSQKHEVFVDLPPLEKGVYIYGMDTPKGKRIKSKRLVIMDL